MTWTCPECGYKVDSLAGMKWGDGVQRLSVAAFICAGCGYLAGIINLVSKPPRVEPIPEAGWKLVAAKNPEFWQAIQAAQAKIRMLRACGGAN